MRIVFVLLSVLVGAGVRAQEAAVPSDAPLTREVVLVPGEGVRVELGQEREVSGTLLEAGPEVLLLEADGAPVSLPTSEVKRLSVKRRSALKGTLWGSLAGTLGVGGFGALLCSAIRDDGSSINVPLCTGGFALVGALLGAGTGTLLGLSVPRWDTVFERSAPGPSPLLSPREESVDAVSRGFSHPGPVGELGVQLGFARELNVERPGGGPGGRVHLLTRLGPVLAFGPEVAWYPIPDGAVLAPAGLVPVGRQLFQLGGLARAGVDVGPVRPAVLAGLAFNSSRSNGFVAYSLGAEVELRTGAGSPPIVLEGRYHDSLQSLGGPDPRFLTFGVGSRVAW